jgi:hypothetical protein
MEIYTNGERLQQAGQSKLDEMQMIMLGEEVETL